MSSFCFFTVPGIICQNLRQIQIFAQYPLSRCPRSAHPCRPGRASAVDPQPIETKFDQNSQWNYLEMLITFLEGHATSERRSHRRTVHRGLGGPGPPSFLKICRRAPSVS